MKSSSVKKPTIAVMTVVMLALAAVTLRPLHGQPATAPAEVAPAKELAPAPGKFSPVGPSFGDITTKRQRSYFFQPIPHYFKIRDFSLPEVDGKPHWTSDTSSTFCTDGTTIGAAEAKGIGLTPECNNYTEALKAGNSPDAGILNDAGTLGPHQMIYAPNLYYPLCSIGLTGSPQTPTDIVRVGWDFTKLDGFTYAGCYGWFEPVAVPGVDQKSLTPDQAYLANSVSDYGQDSYDNVMPYLDSPWDILAGEPDPVNMAFEMDPITLGSEPKRVPISLTTGFFSNVSFAKLANSLAPFPAGPQPDAIKEILGSSGPDIAILKRADEGAGKIKGYVNFIRNQGLFGAPECIKQAFADNCGTCSDPYTNADFATNCYPCIDGSKNPVDATYDPTLNAMDTCPKKMNYSAADVSADLPLEATDDPVFIGTVPIKGFPINFEALGLGGFGYQLVVLNRGPVNCFALDQTKPSIRFRNPLTVAATGDIDDGPDADSTLGIHDSNGLKYFKSDGSSATIGVNTTDPGANSCGYLTFYDVKVDPATGDPKVEILKDKDNGEPVKIPVGFNPTSLGFGDYNFDGQVDIIVANTGSQSEGVLGSLSTVFCNNTSDTDFGAPDAPKNEYAYFKPFDCDWGMVVDDTPIDPAAGFKAGHPWWINANVFKGHMYDKNGADGIDDTALVKFVSKSFPVLPWDAAVTFVDSHASGKGQFGVFLNGIDKRYKESGFKYWTDVVFEPKAVDTGPIDGTPVKKLATGLSLYPLGITSNFAKIRNYDPGLLGLDALLDSFASIVYRGFELEFPIGSKLKMASSCPFLNIGFNNSHEACVLANPSEKATVTYEEEKNCDPAGGDPNCKCPDPANPPNCQYVIKTTKTMDVGRCTGVFAAAADKVICAETTTPTYEKNGNWGPHHLTTTMANLQTDRGMRGDGPIAFYSKFYKDFPTVEDPLSQLIIDLQLDFTPDLGVINGAPVKLAEHKVLADGTEGYTLPNDACKRQEFELTTVVGDTAGPGRDCDGKTGFGFAKSKLTVCAGPDPRTPHRCFQRHGADLYGAICCVMLEGPVADPAKQALLPALEAACPLKDPLACCAAQNLAAKQGKAHNPAVDWLDPAGPKVIDAVYDGPNADACKCEEKRANLMALMMGPPTPAFHTAFKEYTCCMNPADPLCAGPGPCDGIADPKLKDCCEKKVPIEECVGPCTGIADPALKKCCEDKIPLAECMPPPTLCAKFTPGTKEHDCCTKHGGLDDLSEIASLSADHECVPPHDPGEPSGACNDFFNASAGGDVNITINCSNLCCNNCSAKGVGSQAECYQNCVVNCGGDDCEAAADAGGPLPLHCNPACTKPDQPGCKPTIPEGGETPTLPEGACTAEAKNAGDIGPGGKVIGVGKDGSPVSFVVCYRPPEGATGIAQYKLTQIGGQKYGEVEGSPNPEYGALFSGAKAIASKAVTGAGKEDCFVVATPRLTTLVGEQDLTMEFDVAALALDGSTVHSAKCVTPALAQVQGGGEGCGCDMKAQGPADFANLMIGLSALIPLALMAGIRKRAAARK